MPYSCFSRIFNKVTWPTVVAATMRLQIAVQRPHWSRPGQPTNVAKRSALVCCWHCGCDGLPSASWPLPAAEWRPDCLGNNAYREKYCIYVQQQLLTLGISWHQLSIERLYRGLTRPQAVPVSFSFPSWHANHSLFWFWVRCFNLKFKIKWQFGRFA